MDVEFILAGNLGWADTTAMILYWLPDSVCVHSGDWNLIRMFHQGEHGKYAYRLYDFFKGIGEANDLSSHYPDRVATLDQRIEAYVSASNTVVPVPNFEFDPAQYRPELICVRLSNDVKKLKKKKKK